MNIAYLLCILFFIFFLTRVEGKKILPEELGLGERKRCVKIILLWYAGHRHLVDTIVIGDVVYPEIRFS